MTRSRMHLILGPTSGGTTSIAVREATQHGSPVIALDRIQPHPELAIGSGRPTPAELAGTQRLYLSERPLTDGPVTATEAIDQLVRLQHRLLNKRGQDRELIVEGCSISLLHELTRRSDWREDTAVRVTVLLEDSARRYEATITARVERMIGYGSDRRTLQDELAALWKNPAARHHAADIVGYGEALAVCTHYGITPHDLAGPHRQIWRQALADHITPAHLAYASRQHLALADALPHFETFAKEIELCET
ncbi:isopentenyl transferase family protein (plasmid) [Streptomyces sp. NBC_00445]|uniref:isopentenyl transferase family protein n=1 Tax=Streptomyces sp. NBC_00445 TaxID=2975745 RepID=UPI002E1B61E5